jgi:hypothetical protein
VIHPIVALAERTRYVVALHGVKRPDGRPAVTHDRPDRRAASPRPQGAGRWRALSATGNVGERASVAG